LCPVRFNQGIVVSINDELFDAIVFGEKEVVIEIVQEAVDKGDDVIELLNVTMIPALREVGNQFSSGIVFVPEMLVAARAMQGGIDIIEPLLAQSGHEPVAKVCIGSVKGDLHDIGKNLVAMMLEGAGFEVIDLGVDTTVESLIKKIEEIQPDVLGLSALLTTTMPEMQKVIEELQAKGIRDRISVMIGGAPVSAQFAQDIGADAFGKDAAEAVSVARGFIEQR